MTKRIISLSFAAPNKRLVFRQPTASPMVFVPTWLWSRVCLFASVLPPRSRRWEFRKLGFFLFPNIFYVFQRHIACTTFCIFQCYEQHIPFAFCFSAVKSDRRLFSLMRSERMFFCVRHFLFHHFMLKYVLCIVFRLCLLDGLIFKTNVELSEQSGDPVPSTLSPLFFVPTRACLLGFLFASFFSCFVDTAFVDSLTWSSFTCDSVVGIRVVAACGFTDASSDSFSLYKKNLADVCCVDGSFPLERRL